MRIAMKASAMAAALSLGTIGVAQAAEIYTPTLFRGNSQNVCVATNVGPAPVNVTVRMVTFSSGTTEETCTIEPGDPSGCQNFANDLAYCHVTVAGSSKRVRVVMMNREIVAPFTIHATVEGR